MSVERFLGVVEFDGSWGSNVLARSKASNASDLASLGYTHKLNTLDNPNTEHPEYSLLLASNLLPSSENWPDLNRLKVEMGLALGKNVRDKREDIKSREAKRDIQRIAKNAYD